MNNTVRLPSIRLLWGVIIGLVLLNVLLLAWMWLAPGSFGRQPGPRPHGWRGEPRQENFLAQRLHFSPAQSARYDSLRRAYFQQMRPLMERAHATRLDYFGLLDDTTLTDQQLAQRAAAGHAAMTSIDALTLRHFQQVGSLCTPEQRQELKQVLRELPMLRGGGPSGEPGQRGNFSGPPRPGRPPQDGPGGSGPPPF